MIMSSNHVHCNSEADVDRIVATFDDEFQKLMKSGEDVDRTQAERCAVKFQKTFERCLRLNIDYNSGNTQKQDERADYYNNVLYPQLLSLIVEVANKRKNYPVKIRHHLENKFVAEEQFLQMKKDVTKCVDERSALSCQTQLLRVSSEATLLTSESMQHINSFHQDSESLKERIAHLAKAKKYVNKQTKLIDNAAFFTTE